MTPESLKFICRPRLYFTAEAGDTVKEKWQHGDTAQLKVWGYECLPFGNHTIHLERVDPQQFGIQSREKGSLVQIWGHRITMQETEPGRTRYTDQMVIYAGMLTRLVAWWSMGLYKHR